MPLVRSGTILPIGILPIGILAIDMPPDMSAPILPIGIPLAGFGPVSMAIVLSHMPSGFGGAVACGVGAVPGPRWVAAFIGSPVNAPEEPAQVPARKTPTTMTVMDKTAA